ncbi:MAG: alkaline phosphatase family protein, partial [Anaerolineales bacterium]|nr:alkaline phosphatase family protein [Anaerolineales bacterium]
GWPLMTIEDVRAGTAFGSEFTNSGWRTHLKITDVPVYEPAEAGQRLAEAARRYDFAFFEHWMTDYVGHRGTLAEAVNWLEILDAVLGGLLAAWDDSTGLIVLTSDHGNLEDLAHGKHTRNAVPTLIIGQARHTFAAGLTDLTGHASGARRVLGL